MAALLLSAALAVAVYQHERSDSLAPIRKDAEAKPKSPAPEVPAAPLIKLKSVAAITATLS